MAFEDERFCGKFSDRTYLMLFQAFIAGLIRLSGMTKSATSGHRTIKLPSKSKGTVTRGEMREAIKFVVRESKAGRFVGTDPRPPRETSNAGWSIGAATSSSRGIRSKKKKK